MNEELRRELEEMERTDQEKRRELDALIREKGVKAPELQQLGPEMRKIDERNMARLEGIIAEHGWPGRSLAGAKGASGSFLVLQHADHVFQKKYLPLVREAAQAGDIPKQWLPLLEDRVLMGDGEKQVYGTQLRYNQEGELYVWPIEDEARVDERRASMGLPPLAEYLKGFGLAYQSQA